MMGLPTFRIWHSPVWRATLENGSSRRVPTRRQDVRFRCSIHAGTYRAVELSLELRRHPDVLQWRGIVGFVSPRLTYGLLGARGFFEFFAIHYDASQRFLEILPSGTASTTTSQPHIT